MKVVNSFLHLLLLLLLQYICAQAHRYERIFNFNDFKRIKAKEDKLRLKENYICHGDGVFIRFLRKEKMVVLHYRFGARRHTQRKLSLIAPQVQNERIEKGDRDRKR